MLRNYEKRLSLRTLHRLARAFGALCAVCAVRILGLVGTVDYQNAAGLPGMTLSALTVHLALSLSAAALFWLLRRHCLRCVTARLLAPPMLPQKAQPRTSALKASMSASISAT